MRKPIALASPRPSAAGLSSGGGDTAENLTIDTTIAANSVTF